MWRHHKLERRLNTNTPRSTPKAFLGAVSVRCIASHRPNNAWESGGEIRGEAAGGGHHGVWAVAWPHVLQRPQARQTRGQQQRCAHPGLAVPSACESTWPYGRRADPGRGTRAAQPTSGCFHSPRRGQLWRARAQLASSLAFLQPGTPAESP